MRRIHFTEPESTEWTDWRARCQVARDELIREYEETGHLTINEDLYKEYKVDVFMNYDYAFRGKCAYCERDIHNQHGDVEHYRPLKRVTDGQGNQVTRTQNGGVEKHPGYYWLAYEFPNLLPACIICNRPSRQFTEGRLIGKWDRFPVREFRAWGPGDENHEEPLLLNPVEDEPSSHLRFNRNGVLGWRSDNGEMTVRILALNENGLPDRRKERYEHIRTLVGGFITANTVDRGSNRAIMLWNQLERIKRGIGEFTSYALMAIEDEVQEYRETIERITGHDTDT